MTTHGYRVSFGGDKNVLKLDGGDGCTTLNILKPLNCTLEKGEFYGIRSQ